MKKTPHIPPYFMNRCVALILCPVLMTSFFSCNQTFREFKKDPFPMYTWSQDEKIVFKPEIAEPDKKYKITLALRHLPVLRLRAIPVIITLVYPSGEEAQKAYEIKMTDAAGVYLGSCAGDLCDVETVLEESVSFAEPGNYQVHVNHALSIEKLTGIMEIGLIIEQV